jgi:hypothetical protein
LDCVGQHVRLSVALSAADPLMRAEKSAAPVRDP